MTKETTLFLPFDKSATTNLGRGNFPFSIAGNPQIVDCPTHPVFKKAMLCKSNDYIYLNNLNFYNDIINGTNDFTIDYWAYYDLLSSNSGEYYLNFGIDVFRGQGLTQPPNFVLFNHQVYLNSNNDSRSIYWGYSNTSSGNSQYPFAPNSVDTKDFGNKWNHYAIVLKGNDFITFYNGKKIDTHTSTVRPYTGNNCGLQIGCITNGAAVRCYFRNMRVSNVALWDDDFDPYDFYGIYRASYTNLKLGD